VRFIENPGAIDELITSDQAGAFLVDAAGKVKAETERVAPHHTGYYGGTIAVGSPRLEDGKLVVDVYSTDFAASIIEFGSMNNPPYRPLTLGATNLGLEVKDTGKR
jgi:hypothetical protein